VVVSRAGSTITSIETYVGTPSGTGPMIPATRDIGRVPARQAAEYLLSLAARLEGRPARDALMPGVLADSADVWQPLLAIARDQARPRELRTAALTWLGRAANDLGAAPPGSVSGALVGLASDENTEQTVRSQAMATLSRLPRGEGIPALIQMVGSSRDLWLGKRAISTLASSGDPRAREALRTVADRPNISEEIRLTAIRGIGQSYATGQDAAFLRGLYLKDQSPAIRESIISSVAKVGGPDNMRFLATVAGDPTGPIELRRNALRAAGGAEAPITELIDLYGRVDRPLKEDLISLYGRRSETGAIDKLISIAKTDTDPALRRRAISQLSRSKDPRVVAALREIIVP
jgi:HEAT repeat protein